VPSIEVVEADLQRSDHQAAVLELLNAYAMDSMGNGRPLPDDVRRRLIPGLRDHPTTLVLLAFDGQRPVGVAVCFQGFSTFAAKPLINIHDLAVLPNHRGRGIGKQLLEAVEQIGRTRGCCKLTLEVLENNHLARRLYAAVGFAQATYVPEAGGALFLAKTIQ
jgi:ribosomal protein S18 acetylase RimI-like enzyme